MTMFRTLASGTIAAALSLTGLPAAAATIDTMSGTVRGAALGRFGNVAAQSFTAVDNVLTSIAFQFSEANRNNANDAYTLDLLTGDGLAGSSLLGAPISFTVTTTGRPFTFTSIALPGIAVTATERYTAVLRSTNTRYTVGLGPDVQNGVTRDAYAGGQAYFATAPYTNCTNDSTSNCDLNARITGTTVAAIPEPATWATMFLGLSLGGVALRRRARRSVRTAA